jgi:PAS domain S-box-containing protein
MKHRSRVRGALFSASREDFAVFATATQTPSPGPSVLLCNLAYTAAFFSPVTRTLSKIDVENGALRLSPRRRRPDIRMSKRTSHQSPPRASKRAPKRASETAPERAQAGVPLLGPAAPSVEAQVKKLVKVISRSQLNYRELIDSLDHAVFTISLDGEIRVANRRFVEILGVSFPDLIGHRLDEFIATPTMAEVISGRAAFLEKGQWAGRISIQLKSDPRRRFYDCWLQALTDEDHVTSICGWVRDVTSQHESEIRFTELFESLREGIFFTTPEGILLDANPALVRMLGYESKEELKKLNFREIYADAAQRDALVHQVVHQGAVQDVEVVYSRKDGSHIHCLASGFAIRDTFGRTIRMQGTLVDITERIEIEARLHKEQEFVRRLVASFPDMIAVMDFEGRFNFVSPRVEDILGHPAQELVGKLLRDHIHRDDVPQLREAFEKLTSGRAANAQFEYRTKHVDGYWRTMRASASPLHDAAGKINGVVASARDVTDAKAAEKQNLQKEKLAAMGEMMSGVAHELNNPLTAILGVSDLMRERATDDATRRQTEIILKQARRAAVIVQNLLSYARPSALARKKMRPEEALQAAIDQQRAALSQKNISIELAPPPATLALEADPKLLHQVFVNLIVNAEQAITSQAERGALRVSVERADGKIAFVFADDGPGIAPENIGKIFDPFFTTKRPGGGTGLGLAICMAIVKEHGGTIEVQSTPGKGAEFRVWLPEFVEEISAPALAIRPAVAAPAGSEALRGHSVYVVDDEESIREIVQEGLSARGMTVEGASSSEEALPHLAAHGYDFVICDFNLPGLNGEEFFKRMQPGAGMPAPKFVFMSGALLDSGTLAHFAEKGASVLQKPFHIAALATLLTELLQPQTAAIK